MVDVAITLTVQTPARDPVTGLFQKETKALFERVPSKRLQRVAAGRTRRRESRSTNTPKRHGLVAVEDEHDYSQSI